MWQQPLGTYWLHIPLSSVLSHGITAHLNPVSVVNQPVKNALCQGRITDLFVPTRDRQCEVRMVERT
jgi:hypothetical protein